MPGNVGMQDLTLFPWDGSDVAAPWAAEWFIIKDSRPLLYLTQHPVSGQRDDPGTLHNTLGQALRMSPRSQRGTLLGGQHDRQGQMHPTTDTVQRHLLSSYL